MTPCVNPHNVLAPQTYGRQSSGAAGLHPNNAEISAASGMDSASCLERSEVNGGVAGERVMQRYAFVQ